MRQLAVDLGTSSTVAVLVEPGRAPRILEIEGSSSMPSSVYVDEHGDLHVGDDAERRGRLDPLHYEAHPKRFVDARVVQLGEHPVPVVHALAAVLARVAQVVLDETGSHPDRVLLTCPLAWGPRQRAVLVEAARATAWRDREVITVGEVEAAAGHVATAGSVRPGEPLAVLELGAGAVACAVARVDGSGVTLLGSGGLPELSGVGIDEVLLGHVGGQVAGRDPARWSALVTPTDAPSRLSSLALREDVRSAKEQLSEDASVRIPVPAPFGAVTVRRADLEALVGPGLRRAVDVLADVVARAGLRPDQLAGVFLVGGSTRMPLLGTLVTQRLGVEPVSLPHPETATALGAPLVLAGGGGQRGVALGTGGEALGTGSRSRSVVLAAVGALVVVVALVVVGAVALTRGGDQPGPVALSSTPGASTPGASTPGASTTGAAGGSATSVVAPPPVVAGWQTVAAPDRSAAYDVPPGWTVASQGAIGGFEGKAGTVLGKGYTTFGSDVCDQYSSKAVTALTGSQISDLPAGAREVAQRWASVALADDVTGAVPALSTGTPEALTTLAGKPGSLVEVSAPLVPKQACSARSGSMYAYATASSDGGSFVLVVYVAHGVPDEVALDVVRQIATSVRPLDG